MERLLTSTPGDFEARVIVGRLADADIAAEVRGGVMTRGGYVQGGRDVFVAEEDLERAQAVLHEAQDIDEEELARLSEQAGREEGREAG